MKIHVTGANGYVGKALVKAGAIPFECDVTSSESIQEAIKKYQPEFVLHLAGKSDVDFCEEKENQKIVELVNIYGTKALAETFLKHNIQSAMLSTSQIWKGSAWEGNHREDSKPTPPVNFYGLSKLVAESFALEYGMKVIRTSYLFNLERLEGKVSMLENQYSFSEPVFIRRSFLHLKHFVEMIEWYVENKNDVPSVLHLAGSETVSWYKFMKDLAPLGYKYLVRPRYTEIKDKAPRPWAGGLDTYLSKKLGCPQYSYKDGIKRLYDRSFS